MALKAGDISTLDAAVDWRTLFGTNDLNPNNVRDTCVSVALAYMDNYRNIEELWHSVRPGQRIPSTPLSFNSAVSLTKATGWQYKWVYFRSSGSKKTWAYDDLVKYLSNNHPPFSDTFMVLYKRPSGRGHAINLEYGLAPFTDPRDAFKKREWRDFWHFRDHSASGSRAAEAAIKTDLKPAVEIFVLRRTEPMPGKNPEELYAQWKRRGVQIGRIPR